MSYKNPRQLMDAATALPVAIEGRLPEGAPKLSAQLLQFNAEVLSKMPDFPIELPALPDIPELPGLPAGPGALGGLGRYVNAVEVRAIPAPAGDRYEAAPVQAVASSARYEATPAIGRGVLPEVVTHRGM